MTTRLHKEGRAIIPIALLIILAILIGVHFLLEGSAAYALLYLLILGGIVLFALILNFFRNPEIDVTKDDSKILSPCDGKVVVIEEIQDDIYFHGKVLQISIFMSPLNVHVNRNPVGGVVRFFKYFPGKFLVAFNPKSSQLNEQTYMVTENEKVTVGYKQIAGYVARRIKWYVSENDQVEQGAEYGFIRFGSRIDLLLPIDCQVNVNLGDVVKAGRSIIAEVK